MYSDAALTPTYGDPDHKRKKRRYGKPPKPVRSRQKWKSPYPTYYFTDHDPILDIVQTAIEDCGDTLAEISRSSNVSMSTIIGYKMKYVKRPQTTCVFAVLRACRCQIQVIYQGKVLHRWALNPKQVR